jgi:putative ubiquitin-RnfH superfamily antitoxin RatB of RatAB toxin-antitoxin module
VHGIAVRWEHPVCEGDRVEIYHPLPLDPRARRWARAEALRLRRR